MVPPPSSSLSPTGQNSNSPDTSVSSGPMQLPGGGGGGGAGGGGGVSSGMTSPNGGGAGNGDAGSTPGAGPGDNASQGGGGTSSAAVSPAIAASPPIGSGGGGGGGGGATSAASLNFSASSLAGSSVSSSGGGGAGSGSGAGGASSSMTDPVTGQLLAECDPARLAALSYPRLGATGLSSMYSAASYPSTDQNPYPSIAMENSFYGTLVSGTIQRPGLPTGIVYRHKVLNLTCLHLACTLFC